jgi:HK97 family phage major capsid protein
MSRDIKELQQVIKDERAKRDRLRNEALDIIHRSNGPDLTPGEDERVRRLERGITAAEQAIAEAEDEWRDAIRAVASSAASAGRGLESGGSGSPEFMRRVDPFDDQYGARDRARALLDDRRGNAAHLSDGQKSGVDALLRSKGDDNMNVSYVAMRAVLTESPEYRSAFMTAMEAGMRSQQPLYTNEEIAALRRVQDFENSHSRAMNEGTPSAGGLGVPVLIDPTVIITAQGTADLDAILRISRVETITTNQWKGVSSAGVTWSFDTEGSAVSDDSPTLAQPTVPVFTARGFVPYSLELGQDYPSFANEMSRLLMEGYQELVTNKITLGSGTNEPRGIVTALDANTNVEVFTQTAGTLGAVDVRKLWDALPRRFRRNASWMSSTNVENGVRALGGGATDSSPDFSVNITQESVDRLFGHEYTTNEWMADLASGTTAANLLIVGDFKNLLIAQRAGMTIEPVPLLFDPSTGRPTGQRGFFAWARIGSNSVNDNGFRMLENKTS